MSPLIISAHAPTILFPIPQLLTPASLLFLNVMLGKTLLKEMQNSKLL